MAFRDYAVTETSALVARLVAEGAAHRARDLQAVDEAVQSLAQAVKTALAAPPAAAADDLEDLSDRLTDAADADVRAAVERIRAETQSRLDALRTDIDHAIRDRDGLAAACQEAQREIETMRAAVDTERGRADGARADVLELQEKKRKADIARSTSEAAWKAERESLRAELKSANGRAAVLEHNAADQARTRQDLERRLTAALASEQAAHQRVLEAERQAADARAAARAAAEAAASAAQAFGAAAEDGGAFHVEPLQALRTEVVAFAARTLTQLLTTLGTLSTSGTVAEVLRALVTGVSTEFARAAIFSVKGDRLEGIQQVGVATTSDISNLVMPLTVNSLLTQAVATRQTAFVRPGEPGGASVPFGGTPGAAVALPLLVHGEVLAVLYADDDGRPAQPDALELKTKVAELLLQVATPSLERVLSDPVAVAALRDFTTFL